MRTRKGAEVVWEHAVHLLADLSRHVPYPHRNQVSYAGWFANRTGNLGPSKRQQNPEALPTPAPTGRSRWAQRVLRTWQVDPQICSRCGRPMRRSRTLYERMELVRLLSHLGLLGLPPRPPPAPVPEPAAHSPPRGAGSIQAPGQPRRPADEDEHNQVPPDWDDWDHGQEDPSEPDSG